MNYIDFFWVLSEAYLLIVNYDIRYIVVVDQKGFVFTMFQDLKAQLENGRKLGFPDGILINGRGSGGASFNVEQGVRGFSIIVFSNLTN